MAAKSFKMNFRKKCELSLLVKFGMSGAFVTAFAYLIYLATFYFTKLDFLSVATSYLVAIPVSYHLNCKFVFRTSYKLKTYLSFLTMQLGLMFVNYFMIYNLNTFFPRYISALISYGLIPVTTLLISRSLIFKK